MSGLMWLDHSPYGGSWPFCLTFVRSPGEREVLSAFGAGPAGATPQNQAEARSWQQRPISRSSV